MSIDKSQLLAQIGQVFSNRGYDGATLVHLADATGLSKATLYHHFPGGKQEMAATLVRDAISRLQQLAFQHFHTLPTEQAWPAFLQGFREYVQGGRSNCILAVFVHQNTAHEDIADLMQQIHRQFADWHGVLADALAAAGAKPKRARREAHEVMSRLYGALMIAKLHNDAALFDKTITRLLKQTSPT